MRERGDSHLECQAGDSTQRLVYIEDLLGHGFRVADQQGAFGSADRVELRARGGRPSALLAAFGEGLRVPRENHVRGFGGGVREKTDRVQPYSQAIGGVAGATPGFAI